MPRLLPLLFLLGAASAQAETFYFPHFADGSGFKMLFVITNNSDSVASGTLSVFDPQGSHSTLPFEQDNMAVVPLSLPSRGSVLLRSLGTSNPLKSGFVRVEIDQDLASGLAIFQMDSGIEAGVLPSKTANRFSLFVENTSSLSTGVAIMGEDSSSIELTLYGLDGAEVESREFQLPGRQAARFLSELMPGYPTFQGSLELESESAFAVLGIRFGGSVLSTLPVNTLSKLWRGLIVAPESRCSDYSSQDYLVYPASVEGLIVDEIGGIYGPYTGTCFESTSETDIEHIVARSEAHDSGLCAADDETKRSFASDILNLALASPTVNRSQKSDKDAAEWLPELNQCWFANRVLQVRAKYSLTIDQEEADALEAVLSQCASTEIIVPACVQ